MSSPAPRPTPVVPAAARTDARAAALVAGVSTLAMAPLGMLGNLIVMNLAGDGLVGSASRVAVDEPLLGIAVAAFVIVVVLDIVLAWALLRYFGAGTDQHRGLPALAGWLRVGYAGILGSAVGELGSALHLGDDRFVHAALSQFQSTWQLGLAVFGAHLLVLGLLVVRDSRTPTVLGWVILVAGAAYLSDAIARVFVAADSPALVPLTVVVAAASILGEVGLGIWFVARGARRG